MGTTDIAGIVAVLAFLGVLIQDVCRWPKEDAIGPTPKDKADLRVGLVEDIRAANQYAGMFIALLGVIASIVGTNPGPFKAILKTGCLWPFMAAFGVASVGVLFIPAGYGAANFNSLRNVWLGKIVAQQAVTLLVAFGLVQAWDHLHP